MTDRRPAEPLEDLVKLSFFPDIGKAIVSATSIRQILRHVMEQHLLDLITEEEEAAR
jgi:hypothetical protein